MVERPDEFEVMVVKANGCVWETYGIFQTRSEAIAATKGLDPSKVPQGRREAANTGLQAVSDACYAGSDGRQWQQLRF